MIGKFVEYEGALGMIDALHETPMGNLWGFVWSTPDKWVGQLVQNPEKLRVLDGEEAILALESAKRYFDLEVGSLERRIEMHYEIDNEQRLQELLAEAKRWRDALKK